MKKFKLTCTFSNPGHTRFTLFDYEGANCGQLTLRTKDVDYFLDAWLGDIDWNGHHYINPESDTQPYE